MKKIIALFLTAFIATNLLAQGGHLKVTFIGFDCIRETWDDILNSDGKGDEVYFTFGVTLANRNGEQYKQYDKRTKVYGDNTGQWSNRIKAGTCVDLFGNNQGGIRAGDSYRTEELIGEFDIADGDVITCWPTGWEYDPISDNLNSFTSTLAAAYAGVNRRLGPMMLGVNLVTGNLNGLIFQGSAMGLSKIAAGGDQGELGRAGTRPIGMEKYGKFDPKFIAMNTKNLMTTINSDYGYGRGVVSLNYDEVLVGNARDHGNYTIFVRYEFVPKPGSAPAPPPAPRPVVTTSTPGAVHPSTPAQPAMPSTPSQPSQPTTVAPAPAPRYTAVPAPAPKTISGDQRIRSLPAANREVAMSGTYSLAGHWTGTQVNDEGLYPQNIQFDLLENGELQMKSTNGALAAKGTYTMKDNVFTATVTFLSSHETFTYLGSFDQRLQALNFTAGFQPKTTGQGRFTMRKD